MRDVDKRDAAYEGCSIRGMRTGGMQDRGDAGQRGCRTEGMQDFKGCRTGRDAGQKKMQDRWDA